MSNTMKISLNGIKFVATSQETNRSKGNSRSEEKSYLLGQFAGLTEDGEEDTKRLVRAWFASPDDEELVWELSQMGRGVLLLGQYSKLEYDGYESKGNSLSNARLARYNSEGSFVVMDEGALVVFEGEAGKPVTFELEYRVDLVKAETLSAPANNVKKVKSLAERIKEAEEAAASQAQPDATTTTVP
jgi:hypothetical protein